MLFSSCFKFFCFCLLFMVLSVIFLGTSASTPTKNRGLSAIALRFEGNIFLFDCGEGTQRQMLLSRVSHSKVKAVFFSHFHADHILGFPGLIATMNIYERNEPLTVFGPRGVKKMVREMLSLAVMKPCFKIKPVVLKKGVVLEDKKFVITSFPLNHTTKCFGFVFKEKDKKAEFMREKAEKVLGIPPGPLYKKLVSGKPIIFNGKKILPEMVLDYSKKREGKKIAYCVDTLPCNSVIPFVRDSDLLVHDSAFSELDKEKARITGHCTALQAAEIALKAKAKKLFLTHFSARYKSVSMLVKEARKVFPESFAAKDLLRVQLK